MTTSLPTQPADASPARPAQPVAPGIYSFLVREITGWRNDGMVSDELARELIARYQPTRSFSLARLILGLGAAFLGFGVIWLVAANLDQLSPLLRFVVVAVFWIAALVGAEYLATRRAHRGTIPSPVVGAARGVAALAFGAVLFQAAQSLQVPAFEPRLLGLWSLGALLQAYLFRGLAPLVIGLLTGGAWVLASTLASATDALSVLQALFAAGIIGASVAVLHHRFLGEGPGRPGGIPTSFAAPWRTVGSGLTLIALFAAAVPQLTSDNYQVSTQLVVILVLAAIAFAAALILCRGRDRWEPLGALVASLIGMVLVLWEAGADPDQVGAADWGHAAFAVASYVLVAGWIAVLGVLRDEDWLTWIATAALVIFTTFQSFAVFAQIIEGAWLFILLGVIFLLTGYLFDRARREVVATLEGN
jgi:uncharacterized membrane protein